MDQQIKASSDMKYRCILGIVLLCATWYLSQYMYGALYKNNSSWTSSYEVFIMAQGLAHNKFPITVYWIKQRSFWNVMLTVTHLCPENIGPWFCVCVSVLFMVLVWTIVLCSKATKAFYQSTWLSTEPWRCDPSSKVSGSAVWLLVAIFFCIINSVVISGTVFSNPPHPPPAGC